MKNILINLRSPALASFLLVLPFVILELVNRRNFHEGFPLILFGLMWLLPVAFLLILVTLVRSARAGQGLLAKPLNLLIRVAALALIALMWGGLLADQLRCFLGVPNCD